MSKISSLEAVKIQARAVIPVVRALEKELGKEKAHRLVGDAIANSWADYMATKQTLASHPRSEDGQGFPVEAVVVTDEEDEYAVDMTSCEFAEYFRRIGEPEIGALLTCSVDFEMTRRFHPGWELTRTQTLMMGASHCDFCWRRKASHSGPEGE